MRTLGKEFVIGCNYFASNAGCNMWHEWSEEAVEADMIALKENGIDAIRIFPIWSDFQPLQPVCRARQEVKEYYINGKPLEHTPEGRAGVEPVMGERFRRFIALAEKHGVSLMVEMITGWMSGRKYVPTVFVGRNVLTDPTVIRWEVRLAEYLVRTAKDSPAVIAWGLGNETNCMDGVSRDQAWCWTAMITRAIRAIDPTRPIVSGMHSLAVDDDSKPWHLEDQGEHNDIMTIHPYPYYTPHCFRDKLTGIRTILHAAAESRMTADIGGKPCLSQEVGVLGPMIGSDDISADYMNSVMWSLWTCEDLGCLWWLAFDSDCDEAPYDWQASERELGFMTQDRKPKPVVKAMKAFKETIGAMPEEVQFLTDSRKDAVCILSSMQDQWGVAYASYILAKQAGFDVQFTKPDHDWPEADLYMLPSASAVSSIYRRHWRELLRRVADGATLYISMSNAMISSFKDITGLEVQTKQQRNGSVSFRGTDGCNLSIPTSGVYVPLKFDFKPVGAEVLATEEDGSPLFACHTYGKGKVYFLGTAMEAGLVNTPGVFEDTTNAFEAIYRTIAAEVIGKRLVRKPVELTHLALSEHAVAARESTVCAGINHGCEEIRATLELDGSVSDVTVLHGTVERDGCELRITLPANAAFVLELV